MPFDTTTEFDDPELRRQALLNQMPDGKQGVTDPSVRDNSLAPAGPAAPAPGAGLAGVTDPSMAAGGVAGASAPVQPPAGDVGSQIDALLAKAGLQDGGNGSGFADKAYWAAHPSEVSNGRLAADLAGTGSDQPTGTPGTGPWQNSGRNAPEAQGAGGGAVAAGGASQPFGLQNTGLDMNSIMAELQALMTGQKSPAARSSILSQLKG